MAYQCSRYIRDPSFSTKNLCTVLCPSRQHLLCSTQYSDRMLKLTCDNLDLSKRLYFLLREVIGKEERGGSREEKMEILERERDRNGRREPQTKFFQGSQVLLDSLLLRSLAECSMLTAKRNSLKWSKTECTSNTIVRMCRLNEFADGDIHSLSLIY